MTDTHRCGRRPPYHADSPFVSEQGGEFPDHYREDDTCSYCGSLNPATFMKRLYDADVELTPTDKSYKVYVDAMDGKTGFPFSYRNCPRNATCTGPDDCTHWTTETRSHTKFYFQHLSESQMMEFVALYNAKKLRLKYPGHFYVVPFFMKLADH